MQAAANQMGAMLQDSLAAIVPSGSNTWEAIFDHPATGQTVSLSNLVVPANTLIVFAAGADLSGNQTGEGGPGGWSARGSSSSWFDVIGGRGEPGALGNAPTDFAPWGGMIRFDTTGTDWFFGVESTTGLTSGKTDFLSVASHELGHLLGIGTSDSWDNRVNSSGGTFGGPAVVAANGGSAVPLSGTSHWAASVLSGGKKPAMAAVLMNGSRTPFTALDRAALSDIGWEISPGGGGTPSVSLASTNPGQVSEGAGTVTLQVTRSSGEGESTVAYTVEGISATIGVDILGATSGVLTFAAGQTTAEFELTLVDDSLREAAETFQVILSNPTGATLGEWMTGVTIVDNDHRGQGDFDGDGKADLAVFQGSNSQWLAQLSAGGALNRRFGSPRWGTLPIPADYDGDGKLDLAVFRPADARWMVSLSGGGSINKVFGRRNLADLPVPADYDGDGKAELAVFRVAEGRWLSLLSGGGILNVRNATGTLSQVPVPADYDGDGKADLALFQPANGAWIIPDSSGGGSRTVTFGSPRWRHVPVPADYDGDGKADLAVFAPADARWLVSLSGGGTINRTFGGRSLTHVPLYAPIAAMRRLGLLP